MIPFSKRWPAVALFAPLFNAGPLWAAAALENDYVLVSRDDAPCAQGSTPGCAERVIVAMGDIQLRFGKVLRAMRRGEVAVFKAGESYRPPTASAFFGGAIKPMAAKDRPFVIALEEHYWDADVARTFGSGEARGPELRRRLDDLGALRIKEMDEAGIDVQVISHGAPSTQRLDAAAAVPLAKRANDRLHAAVRAHPDRFAGFAALPTADPKAAADELERTVTELGFKGAMVHGPTNGVFFDDRRFWPIFERAQALDVPLYIHPSSPVQSVTDAYYKDYLKDFPQLINAAWGYTVEIATHGIHMIIL